MSCSCSTEAALKRAVNRQPCFRAKSFSSMSKSQPRDTTHEWNRAMRRKWIEHNTVGKATRWRCSPMPKIKALNSPANWNLCFVNWNWKLKETYETIMKHWPRINRSSVPLTKKPYCLHSPPCTSMLNEFPKHTKNKHMRFGWPPLAYIRKAYPTKNLFPVSIFM